MVCSARQRRSVSCHSSWVSATTAGRALYEATKRELAARDWPTMQHYADAKTEVVEAILSRALQAEQQG